MADNAERRREWRLAGIIFFTLIALVVLWTAARIIWPFLSAILIGAILVTLTFPTYQRLCTRMKGHSALAAVIMLIGISLVIVLPLFILALMLVQQANGLIQHLQSGEAQAVLARLDPSHHLEWFRQHIPGFDPASVSPQRLVLPIVRGFPGWVARNGGAVVGGLAGLLLDFGLVLLAMYFFYTEGEAIVTELAVLSPLPERYDREFGMQFKNVIDATFRGYIVTGLVEGMVTALGLVVTGVPSALFWGAFATIVSLLPFIGPPIVWVPAAIYLYFEASAGHAAMWQPIVLTLWGLVLVPISEYAVRPWAMKGKSELPAIPLLFSVIGGIAAFGFIGLVIGPLVFSLLMSIIDIYKRSFRIDSATAGSTPPSR